MIKTELTAILYSKKNYELAYKMHKICKKYNINMVNALDFIELTIKSVELKPQLIICDCSTMEVTSGNLNAFLERDEFKHTKIIFVGEESETQFLKNLVCKNLSIAKLSDISGIIDNLQNEISFESRAAILENQCYNELDCEIYRLLCDLGFSLKYSGCVYLRSGIKNVIANNGIVHSLSNYEYPYIAAIYKTNVSNVERNIRTAISKTWNKIGKETWESFFYTNSVKNKMPTNREFIYMCIELIMPKLRQKMSGIC